MDMQLQGGKMDNAKHLIVREVFQVYVKGCYWLLNVCCVCILLDIRKECFIFKCQYVQHIRNYTLGIYLNLNNL